MRKKIIKVILIVLLTGFTSPFILAASNPDFTIETHLENLGWLPNSKVENNKVFGTTGEHRKLEALKLSSSDPDNLTFRIRTHCENIGWKNEVGNGEIAGTTGLNSGIEAISFKTSGSLANKIQLYFRVHIENYGWTDWAREGEIAGTIGYNCQIEAIQIKVLNLGELPQLEKGDVAWTLLTRDNVNYNDFLHLENTLPHDKTSFTEGLSFYKGNLYESSGKIGESHLAKNINLTTGIPSIKKSIGNEYFGEGSVVFKEKLYLLTYTERKVLIYQPDSLNLIEVLTYPNREGWGLTTDGHYLIASDGTSFLYYMDENLNDIKQLNITFHNNPVKNINELEFIDGYIWANIWLTNDIIIIDPNTGNVIKKVNFDNLYYGSGDVMNGIAFNPETRKLYLTGKYWTEMFEFSLPLNWN